MCVKNQRYTLNQRFFSSHIMDDTSRLEEVFTMQVLYHSQRRGISISPG